MRTIRFGTPTTLLATVLLWGCAATPRPSDPQVVAAPGSAPFAAPAQDEQAPPPMEMHEASAQCWMKYDKSGGSLDAKSKLVNKCIDDQMKAQKPR